MRMYRIRKLCNLFIFWILILCEVVCINGIIIDHHARHHCQHIHPKAHEACIEYLILCNFLSSRTINKTLSPMLMKCLYAKKAVSLSDFKITVLRKKKCFESMKDAT